MENFSDLLAEFAKKKSVCGETVEGKVLSIKNGYASIDVDLKSEGLVSLNEFNDKIQIGDTVQVILEHMENIKGSIVLSHKKAMQKKAWEALVKACVNREIVNGSVLDKTRGGYNIEIMGINTFLSSHYADTKMLKSNPVGQVLGFKIMKADENNSILQLSRKEIDQETPLLKKIRNVSHLKEGTTVDCIVKNIADCGVFVDIGHGITGLIPTSSLSWQKKATSKTQIKEGDKLLAKIIKINQASGRVALGVKQLTENPWNKIKDQIGQVIKRKVIRITGYGFFVEVSSGIEGLIHINEVSWGRQKSLQGIEIGQEVEVKIIDVNESKKQVALSKKACMKNPWIDAAKKYPCGNEVTGTITKITDFGMFLKLEEYIEGIIPLNNIAWVKKGAEELSKYKPGEKLTAKIVKIEPENESLHLDLRKVSSSEIFQKWTKLQEGQVVTCTVLRVLHVGAEVKVSDSFLGFIKREEISISSNINITKRLAIGEKVDAKIISINHDTCRLSLSIKAREEDEHKEMIDKYGSEDSGACLGDILGSAMAKKKSK